MDIGEPISPGTFCPTFKSPQQVGYILAQCAGPKSLLLMRFPFWNGCSLPLLFMFFCSKLKENVMNTPNWYNHFSLPFVFFSAKWKSNGYTPPPIEQVSTLQCSCWPHRVGWPKEVFPFARLPEGKGFAVLSWCLCAVTVWNPFPWEPSYHI